MSENVENVENTGDATVAPHEQSEAVSLDAKESKGSKFFSWVKEHRLASGGIAVALAAAIAGGTFMVVHEDDPKINTEDAVAKRDFNHNIGQEHLPSARTIKGVGSGKFSAIDPVNNKRVDADIVGIDTTGDPNNATLAPPEDISKIGWYVRSAPFGVDKGSTVLTSHVDYNGVTGIGSLFPTLRKGDPITLTDGNGKEHKYVVTQENTLVNKSDPEYIKKTMNTINKSKGENILVMVTCFGEWVGGSLGYASNGITIAKPVEDLNKDVKDFSKE